MHHKYQLAQRSKIHYSGAPKLHVACIHVKHLMDVGWIKNICSYVESRQGIEKVVVLVLHIYIA